MVKGIVYCISNPAFKSNLFKVGYTTKKLETRLECLYKTGVPSPFKVEFAKMVNRCKEKEKDIHGILERMNTRHNPSREFFSCPLRQIFTVFEGIEGKWMIPYIENKEVHKKVQAMPPRPKFRRKAKKTNMNYKY